MTARPLSQMIVRMGGSGPGSDPDPATFCPAHGYIINPGIYVPDPIVTDTPRPTGEKIRLIVTDQGSKVISARCTVANTGKYIVTTFGAGNVQLQQQTVTNNTAFIVTLPASGGTAADGFSYFIIDLTPEIGTNALTGFGATVNSVYDDLGSYIIAAFFSTPGMLTLASAFYTNKRVKHIEINSTANSLTSLLSFCAGCTELQELVLPDSLPALTTMNGMCSGATKFSTIVFPTHLAVLTNAASIFNSTNLSEFTFPADMPYLNTLTSAFQNSNIGRVYFAGATLPEMGSIDSMFLNCSKLNTSISYPGMPKLTTMASVHNNNPLIGEIVFTGSMNLLTTWTKLAYNCPMLKRVVLPEAVSTPLSLSTSSDSFTGCNALEELVLPKTWNTVNNTSTYFFNQFLGNFKLKTFGKVTSSNNVCFGSFQCKNLYDLESWDQPNIYFGGIYHAAQTGIQGKLRYFEQNWQYAPKYTISFANQNFDFTEVRRILNSMVNYKVAGNNVFNVVGNPLIEQYIIKANNPQGTITGRVLKWTKASWIPSIQVGMSVAILQGNNSVNNYCVGANNSFYLHTGFHTTAPANGTRILYSGGAMEQYGLVAYKTYYIVNSGVPSATGFQLSETPGGAVVTFSGTVGAGTSIIFYADCYITSIVEQPTTYDVTFSFPYFANSGSRLSWYIDTSIFDFWEFYVKGYQPF